MHSPLSTSSETKLASVNTTFTRALSKDMNGKSLCVCVYLWSGTPRNRYIYTFMSERDLKTRTNGGAEDGRKCKRHHCSGPPIPPAPLTLHSCGTPLGVNASRH